MLSVGTSNCASTRASNYLFHQVEVSGEHSTADVARVSGLALGAKLVRLTAVDI